MEIISSCGTQAITGAQLHERFAIKPSHSIASIAVCHPGHPVLILSEPLDIGRWASFTGSKVGERLPVAVFVQLDAVEAGNSVGPICG
jgi:hypothetical protein